MTNRIKLSEPHLNGNEIDFVSKAIANNELIYGANIVDFEKSLESKLKKDVHVVCLNSGTSAIHLALIQLGIGRDDEVLCPSFTFCASVNPILYLGGKPIFVDSEPDTWNLSPEYLEIAIKDRISKGKQPKAILVVHVYGMPAKMDEIITLSKKYDIPIVEDAAEALGSKFKNQHCGTFGDFGVLSFNGNKIITTSGGGALITKNKKHKEKTIYYATQSREKTLHYQHNEIGYNYRMNNISASIGMAQISNLEDRVKSKRSINKFYNTLFNTIKEISVFNELNEDYFSNHWLTCINISKEAIISKEDLIMKFNENNIECRPLWKPMHLQPVFKDAVFYGNSYCETLFNTGLCLPSGSNLTKNDLDRIVSVIQAL